MDKEFYIIGGGLAGCILGYTLAEKYNQDVWLVDDNYQRCASRVAAGIFNPITGKRMVKTWLADDIFPFMLEFYSLAETRLNVKFLFQNKIIKPFDSIAEQNEWTSKTADPNYTDYLQVVQQNNDLGSIVNFDLGGIEIQQSGWIDCVSFIETIKAYFLKKKKILTGKYDSETHKINCEQNEISISDTAIMVNCTGFQAAQNPMWKALPWQLAKGEIMTIRSTSNIKNVINKSVFVCPTAVENEFKVGATYVWNDISPTVSDSGVKELTLKLRDFYMPEFEIVKSEAEVRPTVKNRKPFLGQHPVQKDHFIFNGFGSKTVSMAPYFANVLAQNMLFNKPIAEEVDIKNYF